MASPLGRRRVRGFTLLEIMVALAIFSTLAAAVLSASQYVVRHTAEIQDRLFAAWLADNQLNELQLQSGWVVGQSRQVIPMDRRNWSLQQRISATGDPRLLRVDIEVGLAGREQPVHRASGWVANRDN
ncbi:Type II secretion system protein I [Pseudomonas fluorescens]|uniref:Type II secretion system protein I n=1 Tax=Pseudomonas fluorescens TaxID=294 RepID=A0A5E6VGY2_PSEFL|nr:type II secretion system minor pseudopilin GspI [Pseudomonas fluorescens]VVN16598.1 Type II secretion system protein I [Pseudomonas fluorescens]